MIKDGFDDSWWASFDGCTRGRGVKREPGTADDEDVKPTSEFKRRFIERRKSVRFADEADSELECVYPIPVKEETWPYGSLSGENFPKAFPEFDHLYGDVAKKQPTSSLNLGLFEATDMPEDDDLDCFNDIKACVGMAFLMMDGSIARGVCATSKGLWGKKFVRQETLSEGGHLDAAAYEGLRPADYIETDMYVEIKKGDVASVCRVISVDADMPSTTDGDGGVLSALTRTSPMHKGKAIKTFFYSWYFCQSSRTAHPYLASDNRAVSVFWPADRHWYTGVLDGVEGGMHRVVYDVDGSIELVNLLQLREQGCLNFLD